MPDEKTVANSSCLIALDAIGRLDLLRGLYGQIDVPDAVAQECGAVLPGWVQVHRVQNRPHVSSLALELGAGEAEAIALCSEMVAARLILDDKKARRIARQLSLPVTGTLAILLVAKNQGRLSTVREVVEELRAVNFHVSDTLVEDVLRQAGE